MNVAGDLCPRCGGAFHCGVSDSAPCACTTVTLDARTLAALRARFDGCLCLRCLSELSGSAALGELATAKEKAGPV